jgi:hypothetical protein
VVIGRALYEGKIQLNSILGQVNVQPREE